MNDRGVFERIKQLFNEICSEGIKIKARLEDDLSRGTRQRKMPLSDILICTLGKKGLSTTMELRQYYKESERVERTVSKQDYLRRRQKLNPEVFNALNRNYLKRFYEGQELNGWRGYLVMAVDGLHDVFNRFILDVGIHKNGCDEIAEAKAHISALKEIIGERPVLSMYDRN